MKTCIGILVLLLLHSPPAGAHGNHHHGEPTPGQRLPEAERLLLGQIDSVYIAQVRPIFQAKCFDCHSNQTRYPWYHDLPGIKQWLDRDVAEGKTHIDMSHDFPFSGHGSPIDDLQAIQESLEKKSMPPLGYRVMHPESGLSEEDKQIVTSWVRESLQKLQSVHP